MNTEETPNLFQYVAQRLGCVRRAWIMLWDATVNALDFILGVMSNAIWWIFRG